MNTFTQLPLIDPLRKAVAAAGYDRPTPIQSQAIPLLLDGRDLLGCAQTGTGKTAAFALPMLQRLGDKPASGARSVRALVLTPTRELAAQIEESFRTYGRHLPLKTAVVFGGVGKGPQAKKLRRGVDILVATPGRLLDLLSTRDVNLERLEIFVLDEADRMLDMGFIHDVRRIIATLPERRQTLFFSATMPKAVAGLADSLLRDPVKIEVVPQATPAERIEQSAFFVDQVRKDTLLKSILDDPALKRVLIFTRTKHRANRVAKKITQRGIGAEAIHGNKTQNARIEALHAFRNGNVRVLVATDIAARGIDIDDITHVINYEMPNEPEVYVHRIGRTARAGNGGYAVSFCSGDERDYLSAIEQTMGRRIRIVRDQPHHSSEAERGLVDGQDGARLRKQKASSSGNSRYNEPKRSRRGGKGKSSGADNSKNARAQRRPSRSEAGGKERKKAGDAIRFAPDNIRGIQDPSE